MPTADGERDPDTRKSSTAQVALESAGRSLWPTRVAAVEIFVVALR
jgi:hypothetical protein